MSKIVLTGGGTAGHVTACLALIPELKKRFDEIHYIGSDGIEKSLLATRTDIVYHEIPCAKRQSGFKAKLTLPFNLIKSVRSAKSVLKKIKPDIIFGKGGYVSLPVALASGKTPLILHESDTTMGLANRIASFKASTVCTTFEIKGRKNIHTGTPLRPEIYTGDASHILLKLGVHAPILLITGGSQGAAAINTAVRNNLSVLTKIFHVVHLTGIGKSVPLLHPKYTQIEYTENPADLFASASVVVTRGGANTLFELAALHKPMVIIPLPKSTTSRGDQVQNAAYFAQKGLAYILPQSDLSDNTALPEAVKRVFAARASYAKRLENFSADGTLAVLHEIDRLTHPDAHSL